MGPWGFHLVLDVKAGDINLTKDPNYISDFAKILVKEIDMVPYGEPQVVHFAEDTDKAGWTLIQLITTSNIMCHFLDSTGDFYFDLFSCKEYDTMKVIQLIQDWFKPLQIKSRFIEREA